jgi:hypothetical protein
MSAVIRYTIDTEHCAPTLVGRYFDGYSITSKLGFWRGKSERSVSIVILATESDRDKVLTLARDIREQYRQQEVWITSEPVTLTRITIDATLEGLPT